MEAPAEEVIGSGHTYARRHFGRAEGPTGKVSFERAARLLPHDLRADFLILRGKSPSAGAPAIDVQLSSADPGYSLSRRGDLYRIETDTAVAPPYGELSLVVDRHPIRLRKLPGGLSSYERPRQLPQGYGGEEVSEDRQPGRIVTTLRIKRDPVGALTEAQALEAARDALVDEAKRMMREDRNWRSYFPTTWRDAEARGIMDGIRSFPAGDGEEGEVNRHTDRFLFTGRGPFGLYSEVRIDKATGEPGAYIEID